jgi:hypothetical protein
MKSDILNFVFGMYMLGAVAFQVRSWHFWLVLLVGGLIACLGAWGGFESFDRGQATHNTLEMYFGQVFMIFASVLGGALVSTAFTEMRAEALSKAKSDG